MLIDLEGFHRTKETDPGSFNLLDLLLGGLSLDVSRSQKSGCRI